MKDNQQRVTDATGQAIYTKTAPGGEERERRAQQHKQDIMGRRSVQEGRNRIGPPWRHGSGSSGSRSLRGEYPSVPGNHQSTADVQQVRRDKRDSTEKGVVFPQVMEQNVEEVREKSEDDVTIRRAKEVRQRPTTLTMDTEDAQTEEMQVPEHDGETPER